MSAPKPADELLLRYQQACAQDERRPNPAVRDAVRTHAAMLIRARQSTSIRSSLPGQPPQAAANQTRWKLSLLASVALVGLTGLLVLQFDRGTPEEQELALGRPQDRTANTTRPPEPAAAPPFPSAPTEKAMEAAPTPALPQQAPAALPQAKPSVLTSKADLAKSQAPQGGTQGLDARPSTMIATPSPAVEQAPAPIPAAPATATAAPEPMLASRQRLEGSPAPAKSLGSLEAFSGAMGANPAQRDAKAIGAPAMLDSSRQALEKPEPHVKRAQERALSETPGARDLNAALLDTARTGQLTQVERLLQQGALINSSDESGKTPLMLAAMNGHTTTVAKLLALGANPALTDREGLNALQHARRLGFNQIANLLEAGH